MGVPVENLKKVIIEYPKESGDNPLILLNFKFYFHFQ
jgi:hypothetical protein